MGRNRYTAPTDEDATLEGLSKGWPKVLQRHPLHMQHTLIKSLRPSYSCDSCHTPGNDCSFLCATCDFDLHPDCALEAQLVDTAQSWPRTVQYTLHRSHPLVKTRLDTFWCDSCGERGSWWCFYCEQCDFGLHLHCAVGPSRYDSLQNQSELDKTVKETYWCSKCAEEGKGPCYSWEECNVDLHPRCAGKGSGLWPKSTNHELHSVHELVKSQNIGYYCNKCWTEGQGWSFGCNDCDFHLHPRCATESPTEETGWIDGMMHEQLKQQVLQQLQEREDEEEVVADLESRVQVRSNEEEELIHFTGGGLSREQETKMLQDAAAEQLQLESTMSQLEQIRLYAEAVAMIHAGSARTVSDLAGGLPQRRREPPPYNWSQLNRPFGYR